MENKYDVIVIGSGPGGEGAAMTCAKGGKKVAVCEEFSLVGGSNTHKGTIPSKALRHASQILYDSNRFEGTAYQELLKKTSSVISSQVNLRHGFYTRNGVDLLIGRAKFLNSNSIEVTESNGLKKVYEADAFIIATGSRPYHPPDVDFTHPRIVDSDSLLKIEDNPKTLTIYGAGVIGCEYASIFRGLTVKVNLINTRPQLLAFLDDEIIDALAYHLRENGVLIRHSEEYEKVVPDDTGVTIYLKSNKEIRSEYLLWAQGRTGNSSNIGLEGLNITTDSRGSIPVNEFYQSSVKNIYAVGDVIGYPSLASAAYDQGRFAARHLIYGEKTTLRIEDIPTGIYTIPEISSVGLNERELTEKKIPYEVGHSFFRHLARAQITGRTVGMLKILFHRENFQILGIHCFGYEASEIIHIGQAIMSQQGEGNTLMYFINSTFNYPTMAEAYRVAALNGLNRIEMGRRSGNI
ncbi:MAG: Si-specific NAD(P)(+) transhydrogenase [Ignavibacteriae bacterium HGW-Ignavibacteriae-3]|nr:MAG: Si-specific NAD(P)(+) transhydrogenase [Ignavibacteriae bacterium HGW-Ignavibacteriae-3]